jgi:Porin subfamily
MNIKSLLLGSAAALVAATGARAADAVVVAEPEPVEYVRVCDVYGAGFYYIPGTETCLKVSGYLRYDIGAGDNGFFGVESIDKKDFLDDALNGSTDGIVDIDTDGDGIADSENVIDDFHNNQSAWYKRTRFQLRVDARSETELGTLRAYLAFNMQATTGNISDVLDVNGQFREQEVDRDSGLLSTTIFDNSIEHAYLELGGFLAGKTDSLFSTFTGYAGGVIHDDIIPYGPFDTNTLRYTFNAGNGFTAAVALEDPAAGDDQFYGTAFYTLDDYVPNVVAGVGYTGGWGGVSVVGAYDAVWEKAAVKARLDVKVADYLSLFVMGGWADKDDIDFDPVTGDPIDINLQTPNWYGGWGGDWAIFGGGTWQVTPKAAINVQLSYDDFEDFAAVANVAYELVPGFTVTPEIAYIDNFSDNCGRGNFGRLDCTIDADGNADQDGNFGGFLRLQRNF